MKYIWFDGGLLSCQIYGSGFNRPENENEKNIRHKPVGETKVSGIRWLGEE